MLLLLRHQVDEEEVCEIVSGTSQNDVRSADELIVEQMSMNFEQHKSSADLKWQYLGTEEGVLTIFPASSNFTNCTKIDPRFR